MDTKIQCSNDLNEICSQENLDSKEELKGKFSDEISNKKTAIEKIIDIKKKKRTLLSENGILLQKLLSIMNGPLGHDFIEIAEILPSANKQTFFNLLNIIDCKSEEMHAFEIESRKEIESLKNEISETETKYKELNDEYKSLKERTAFQSVNSNTGELFSKKKVQELLLKEQEAEEKLQCYQLEYTRKKYNLEETIQKKQNLVEGPVNYAEYDVLCTEIENNIEVTKQLEEDTEELQKKMFAMINIISHLTQKLQFIQNQKEIAEGKKKSLEEELDQLRKSLFREKMKFNNMKDKNEDLQHRFILLQHPQLIEDYKNLKIDNENVKKELQQLKDTYENSMKIVSESTK